MAQFISSSFILRPLTDHSDMLQERLIKSAGKALTFPSGTFNVRTLTVPPRTRLHISGDTTLRGLPVDTSTPILTLQNDVHLTGSGQINGNRTLRRLGTGISINSAHNVLVDGIRIHDVAEQGVQVVASHNLKFTKLRVIGCGLKGVDQYQGINLVISSGITITGCSIADAMHGIQWWGDDKNGYCENLTIYSNRIKHVIGGIWGNRGCNILVNNNVAEVCADVGIDFEHSFDCQAMGNTVRDCKNYGLATFFGSERIQFIQNRVFQGKAYGHGIGLCGQGTSKHISFIGGSIKTKGPSSCGVLTVGANVAQDILLQGLIIVTEGKNGIPIRVVDNNQFQIVNNPLIAGANPAGISLEGSSQSLIQGNSIQHRGIDASNLGERGGIFIYFRSTEYPAQNNVVRRNTIQGFRTGINDECWGNVNSQNTFENNVTPNISHRAVDGSWGGQAKQNQTATKSPAPFNITQ